MHKIILNGEHGESCEICKRWGNCTREVVFANTQNNKLGQVANGGRDVAGQGIDAQVEPAEGKTVAKARRNLTFKLVVGQVEHTKIRQVPEER